MAPISRSLSAKITLWKLLDNRIAERLAEMPHVQEAHARLRQLVAEAETVQARFELHRAGWREASIRNEQIERECEELRIRLTGALHFQLGPKSVQLIEFGLKPRLLTGRPKKSPEERPPPQAPADPAQDQQPKSQSP